MIDMILDWLQYSVNNKLLGIETSPVAPRFHVNSKNKHTISYQKNVPFDDTFESDTEKSCDLASRVGLLCCPKADESQIPKNTRNLGKTLHETSAPSW